MKKILLILLFMCFMINVNATTIDKIYMDAEVEIGGGIKVREIIDISDMDEDLDLSIYYKDDTLKDFDGSDDSYIKSNIYNGTRVVINYVGIIKKDVDITKYTDLDFAENNVDKIEHKFEDKNGYSNVIIDKDDIKETQTIFLDYTVINILVEHNDCAEFYYKLLDNFNYDVNEISIIVKLPRHSELFKVWAHGDNSIKTTIDGESSMVTNTITNYKKGTYLDNRIIFDKTIFSININESKKTKIDSVDKITQIENNRIKNTKTSNLLLIGFITSIVILAVLIISYVLWFNKKKKM